jgi:hypothetical protein
VTSVRQAPLQKFLIRWSWSTVLEGPTVVSAVPVGCLVALVGPFQKFPSGQGLVAEQEPKGLCSQQHRTDKLGSGLAMCGRGTRNHGCD